MGQTGHLELTEMPIWSMPRSVSTLMIWRTSTGRVTFTTVDGLISTEFW